MKKALTILICLPLLVLSGDAKTRNKNVLLPRVQANQTSVDPKERHGEIPLLIREAGNAFVISAGMIAGDADTVRLALEITNGSRQPRQFGPDEIVVLLPNGHSYRPFSQVDVLAQAYEVEADPKGKKASPARAEFHEASATAGCSADRNPADCPTTADLSMPAWRDRRLALRAMVSSDLRAHKFKGYVRELKENYLVSQPIASGGTITGHVDLYVEDIRNGPFTVRVPAGSTTWSAPAPGKLAVPKTTYDFRFGGLVGSAP